MCFHPSKFTLVYLCWSMFKCRRRRSCCVTVRFNKRGNLCIFKYSSFTCWWASRDCHAMCVAADALLKSLIAAQMSLNCVRFCRCK